jgi:hypothetical protein
MTHAPHSHRAMHAYRRRNDRGGASPNSINAIGSAAAHANTAVHAVTPAATPSQDGTSTPDTALEMATITVNSVNAPNPLLVRASGDGGSSVARVLRGRGRGRR